MTAADVVAARQSLELTPEALAAELGLAPAVIAAWEAGTLAVPPRFARELAWRVAAAERRAALAASGLAACGWVAGWELAPPASGAKAELARLEALTAHAAACPGCRAREAYVAERFPPMPAPPVPGWVGAVDWVWTQLERLPRWLRPVVIGALLFIGLTAVRVVLGAPRLLATPGGWLIVVKALAAGAGMGAMLGAAYGVIQYVRVRIGRTGSAAA